MVYSHSLMIRWRRWSAGPMARWSAEAVDPIHWSDGPMMILYSWANANAPMVTSRDGQMTGWSADLMGPSPSQGGQWTARLPVTRRSDGLLIRWSDDPMVR